MKKIYAVLLITFSCFCLQNHISAQCEPDIINCIDIDDPGQMCPTELPDGTTYEEYNQVVTIIPPYEADLGTGALVIVKIIIDSINNLPPGLSWEANAEEFYAYSAYCVLLNGTPTKQGIYDLSIHVIPFIDHDGVPVAMPAQIDDTSLTITIISSGVNDINAEYSNLFASPNPFNSEVSIEFHSGKSEISELKVYSFQGKLVYQNLFETLKGSNEFEFKGDNLKDGIYYLTIQNNHQFIGQKLIKLN